MKLTATRLHDNVAAYDRYKIRPRILRDVSRIDTTTTLFGKRVSLHSTGRIVPVFVAAFLPYGLVDFSTPWISGHISSGI